MSLRKFIIFCTYKLQKAANKKMLTLCQLLLARGRYKAKHCIMRDSGFAYS